MSDDEFGRAPTLHGEPLPLPPPPPLHPLHPQRPAGRTHWLLIAVSAMSVLVLGLGGLLVWLLMRDDAAAAPAREAVVVSAPGLPPQAPSPDSQTVQTPAGQNPAGQNPAGQNPTGQNPTGQNPTATEHVTAGTWYAQFGAFNDYGNAQAEAARHYGGIILPGSTLGLSTRYVVVRAAASRAEAAQVCAQFAEGACYVRSGE
ncbi:hypothetical protein [Gordonia sp. (in: high G+C Gram-positive bacteria)]|uniref:hypothetical protein n=1 Tax=Gordonia sp. (in: high G+C Gram-positive bacteria) TaxID=84139 RepID=UPI003C728C64